MEDGHLQVARRETEISPAEPSLEFLRAAGFAGRMLAERGIRLARAPSPVAGWDEYAQSMPVRGEARSSPPNEARRSRVLVVDDEPAVRLGICRFLEAKGFETYEAEDCRSAEEACAAGSADVAIVDYKLPDGSGVDLVRRLKETNPGLAVIVLTAHGSIELAVKAIKEGADQFLTKPIDLQAVLLVLERLVEGRRNREKVAGLRRSGREAFDPFLGTSPSIRRLAAEARRLLDSDSPVLIQGETGSGKGVLARWLHDNGPRRDDAFVDLNCASLGRDLLESELFGHEAGAFTGAVKRKLGLLEVAHGGSVFLDEIGDMDSVTQARVLKVLEERRFRRVGDVRDRTVDVRLIAATNHDLRKLTREGRFRDDLFYRISALPLAIPPLRERPEDVPVLAGEILASAACHRAGGVAGISEEALSELRAYSWPGNIRELRNVLERALLVRDGDLIRPPDFRFEALASGGESGDALTLEEVERRHIARVLRLEEGHIARAAKRLGISVSSLYERVKRYGIPARER